MSYCTSHLDSPEGISNLELMLLDSEILSVSLHNYRDGVS